MYWLLVIEKAMENTETSSNETSTSTLVASLPPPPNSFNLGQSPDVSLDCQVLTLADYFTRLGVHSP